LPSPVAHTLAGLAIAHACAPAPAMRRVGWYAFAAFFANAADLDFAVGLAAGSINGCHGGAAHSVGAAVGFAAIAAIGVRQWGFSMTRMGLVAFALYASHVLLDMACEQSPLNPGMTVLWPFTTERYLFGWRPFPGIAHGPTGGTVAEFFDELISVRNLRALGFELLALGPLLVVVCWVRGLPGFVSGRRSAEAAAIE
jgi:membrane-bound metal-dependent hydrolase YbcI (DUF457 family)